MFRLLLASILVLTSSIAKAQIEEEECHGDKYLSVESDDIWAGDFRVLYIGGGWADGYAHKSIGVLIGGGTQDWGEGAVCFSLSPFTTTNTNNGETCTNEGPFTVAANTTYYRMQIDRSQTPTRYCQILIKTGDTAPSEGETEVVTLDANGNNSGNVPDPDGPGDDNGRACADITDWDAAKNTEGWFCKVDGKPYEYADFHVLITDGTDICSDNASKSAYGYNKLPAAEEPNDPSKKKGVVTPYKFCKSGIDSGKNKIWALFN